MRSNVATFLTNTLAGLVLLVGGCSSSTVKIKVEAPDDVNGGKTLYAVVRAVDQGAYTADTTENVGRMVFVNPPDPSVLKTQVVYPGRKTEIEVTKPDTLPLGIYFLFFKPGAQWKVSVPQPMPSSVSIELGTNDIKTTE